MMRTTCILIALSFASVIACSQQYYALLISASGPEQSMLAKTEPKLRSATTRTSCESSPYSRGSSILLLMPSRENVIARREEIAYITVLES
jgi:hypothetical protein